MDFKRIEWIFFLSFLGLNIFLFGIYRDGVQDGHDVAYSDQTEPIENRLAKDGITYKGALSSEKMEGYYLSGEQTNLQDAIEKEQAVNNNFTKSGIEISDNTLISYPQKNYFIDEKHVETSVHAFVDETDTVLFGEEYEYFPEFSNLKEQISEIIAVQTYKGIPFYDDTAKLIISAEKSNDLLKITKYTQTHIGNIDELRDKMDLYSQRDIIDTLYINNKIPSNSKISFVKLAYSRIYKIREKNVYVPVWFVGVTANDSTQVEQVNAISNTIITNNTVPKVEKH
jgi:regulatory protein YycI of two-component signal transduction system YycFG